MSPEACHLCGQDAAIVIDGVAWCAGCLHARGSCCAESEMDECPDTPPPRDPCAGGRRPDGCGGDCV